MKILKERRTFLGDNIPASEITYFENGEIREITVLKSSIKNLEETHKKRERVWKGVAIGLGILSLILAIKKK